jgi:hypothetical protein
MTHSEILEDYLVDKIEENPELKLEMLTHDKTLDSAWLEEQQQAEINEALKQTFSKNNKKELPNDFEVIAKDSV